MKYVALLIELKKKLNKLGLEEAIAYLIIEDFLGRSYHVHLDDEVKENHLNRLNEDIIPRLERHEPIQYILGYTYFYGLKINVNKDVLIPRNETEELVEWLLDDHKEDSLTILDIGSGSGCIALAIKSRRPNWKVISVDISNEALMIAKDNASKLNIDVDFRNSNILENINESIDIVISNPPYIEQNDINVDESTEKYEPHLALYADDEGLYFYKEFSKILPIKKVRELYIEFGFQQAENIKEIYKKYDVEIRKDLNKLDRMARIIF
ncbi:MAG: peptide chain release factor N(5)-glutamine methyltransferase [Bacilli bacterium]|nr:peptide chain release factor N(5)-glutamine methyltransferase [Bacilli bacterium]